MVPDHEPGVEVHSEVAIQPYSCWLAGLRHQSRPRQAPLRPHFTSPPPTKPPPTSLKPQTHPKHSRGIRSSLGTCDACHHAGTIGVVDGAGDGLQSAASGVLRTIASLDLTMVWFGAALVVPWFGWRIVDDYLARRRTASIVVRHFAD